MRCITTDPLVLAADGSLDGRRATTHWLHTALLAAKYPMIDVDPSVLYIDEGQVLTSAGKTAGFDLCLHVVRTDHGATAANALARRLVMPPHREGGQAQFLSTPVTAGRDHVVSTLLPWVSENLDRRLTVVDLAKYANMST